MIDWNTPQPIPTNAFYAKTDWLFGHLKQYMARENRTYRQESWHNTFSTIVTQKGLTYVESINAHREKYGERRTQYGHNLHDHIRGMAYQNHATTLFQVWLRNHAELYDPNEATYQDLTANLDQYERVTVNPFNKRRHVNLILTDHPIQERRFEPHLMRHPSAPLFSLMMWIPSNGIHKTPLSDWRKFKKLPAHMQDRIYLQNYHQGYSAKCSNQVGFFCYCQYTLALTEANGVIHSVHDLKNDPELFARYQQGKLAVVWRTQVMFLDKNELIEGKEHNQFLFNHINLLTCLQNPKTVVTTTSNHTRQQLKKAKRNRRKLVTNKTLLVHTETLSQINPLRVQNPNAHGSQHSYSYDRAGGKAKKWVLKANLELGMEVFAKKPRKNGEGYLYLVQGTRKGTVCNPHLPPKQKEVQTVKVKSFKTP